MSHRPLAFVRNSYTWSGCPVWMVVVVMVVMVVVVVMVVMVVMVVRVPTTHVWADMAQAISWEVIDVLRPLRVHVFALALPRGLAHLATAANEPKTKGERASDGDEREERGLNGIKGSTESRAQRINGLGHGAASTF